MDSARPVTLQDVADRAGVARATASLALSGKGRMTDATRQRVRDAAEDLDYVVNIAARNLRAARSGAVGLYVPDHTLSFRYYMDVAFGAVERGQESELLVTLMPTDFDARSRITEHLDGFILIDPQDGDPVVERLLRGRRPVVSGEGTPEGMPAPDGLVFGDHRRGIRVLLDHLWEQGSRHPLCMLPGETIAWGRDMLAGYRDWCGEKGIPAEPLMGSFGTTADEMRRLLDERLAHDPAVDAIIGAPEGTALIAVDALRSLGRPVGRDVLVASYVDSDALALAVPSITALDLQPRRFGRDCMDLLVAAIEQPDAAARAVEVPISLVVRDSTRRNP